MPIAGYSNVFNRPCEKVGSLLEGYRENNWSYSKTSLLKKVSFEFK